MNCVWEEYEWMISILTKMVPSSPELSRVLPSHCPDLLSYCWPVGAIVGPGQPRSDQGGRSRRSRGRSRRGKWWRCHVGTFCVKRDDWAISGTTRRALVHSTSLSTTWFSPRIRIWDHCHDCQTWDLSKNFHCRIFRPEHLHHQFHLISTVLVGKNRKN